MCNSNLQRDWAGMNTDWSEQCRMRKQSTLDSHLLPPAYETHCVWGSFGLLLLHVLQPKSGSSRFLFMMWSLLVIFPNRKLIMFNICQNKITTTMTLENSVGKENITEYFQCISIFRQTLILSFCNILFIKYQCTAFIGEKTETQGSHKPFVSRFMF